MGEVRSEQGRETADEDVLLADAGPLRTCIVTRDTRPPEELIRFVLSPDGTVVPDVARKLPGRGVWVGLSAGLVAEAVTRKAFARAFRKPVKVPADLALQVDGLLLRRALEAISLANKAGAVVTGFVKVEKLLEAGDVARLVHASDAAADGVEKLERRLKAAAAAGHAAEPAIRTFSIDELSLAMGRPNVVHAALRKGGASKRFGAEAVRLARYRAVPGGRDAAEASSAVSTGCE